MNCRIQLVALVVSAAAVALLPGCVPPTPPPQVNPLPPAPPPLMVKSLALGGLGFPAVAGSQSAATGSTGASTGATSGTSAAGAKPPAPATSVTVSSRGSRSGGGGSSSGEAVITLEGRLDHPTRGAGSGRTVQVANEAELRAALADEGVSNIELTADIDFASDAATPDLAIERPIGIDGMSHVLAAGTVMVTASGVVLQRIDLPNAFEVTGSNLFLMNSTLGSSNPNTTFTATGGDNVRLSSCDIVGGTIGMVVRSGAALNLSSCNVTTGMGAFVNGATLTALGGSFTNTGLGINVINGVVDIDAVTFAGTANAAISLTAHAAGTELTVDDASFRNSRTGIIISGTTPAAVAVRTSWFFDNDLAIDFNGTSTIRGPEFGHDGRRFGVLSFEAGSIHADQMSGGSLMPSAFRAFS